MGAVRGVLIDESLLFLEDEEGNLCLRSESAILLRRLQYSKLRVGICHQADAPPQKATLLAKTAASYSFECISLRSSCASDSFNELFVAWGVVDETCFYVTPKKDDKLFSQLGIQGWRIICTSSDNGVALNKVVFIEKVEELLITICRFSKLARHNTTVLIIGYVMKPSREEDFAKRGAFPMYPTQNGLLFVPLTFELPLASQIQQVDVVLHKATDEIIGIDLSSPLDFPERISFSKGMRELERHIQDRPDSCMIDPLNKIYPLLDRHEIQQILLELEKFNSGDRNRVRAPHYLKVDSFHDPNIKGQLSEAKLSFPVIVKPQVACGVADAHNMALVFKVEDFMGLRVPLPAIVQEYVDHGSSLFKFYVLGDKIFHAVKKSMPNASCLLSPSDKTEFGPIIFNSLKSLPVAKEEHPSAGEIKAVVPTLDLELVNNAARWLRKRLQLTIFGFDVVIQEGSGDHVIVDLNYLPSFKEVPDSDAIPAFWEAIKSSYELMKSN